MRDVWSWVKTYERGREEDDLNLRYDYSSSAWGSIKGQTELQALKIIFVSSRYSSSDIIEFKILLSYV